MKKLLITGGTGSFGNAVAKHFLKDKNISEIVIFSRDEKKQHDMYHSFNNPKLKYVIGDIRNERSIAKACRDVDYIFHAAALKQVPTGEYFPFEMVQTNIIGTENVLNAAEENNVKKVVLLSTDKAVYPINAMGMSKALAEKLVSSHARSSSGTVFCAVRYGNVMTTRGSVIPLFVNLIKQNKPLIVTDPAMTRFLISLDDSISLVNLAISKGKQGDLFVMKAPSVTIGDLAQAMLNIFNAKNKINIIGLRAGEKIHETLVTQSELVSAEELGEYYRIRNGASKKYDEFFDKGTKTKIFEDYTSKNAERLSIKEIEKLLLSLDFIKEELKPWQK
jgi:UDP-N-acetylglucosamine 4,6-dehydratase/5-epimerase